jgi:multidrug resistance efflux pump
MKEARMLTRDEYVAKLKSQLDEWNAALNSWEAKANAAQTDVHIEYQRRIDALRQQRDSAVDQLKRIQSAAGNAWLDLARGADEAWEKIHDAFEKARSNFQK